MQGQTATGAETLAELIKKSAELRERSRELLDQSKIAAQHSFALRREALRWLITADDGAVQPRRLTGACLESIMRRTNVLSA